MCALATCDQTSWREAAKAADAVGALAAASAVQAQAAFPTSSQATSSAASAATTAAAVAAVASYSQSAGSVSKVEPARHVANAAERHVGTLSLSWLPHPTHKTLPHYVLYLSSQQNPLASIDW